MMSGRPGDRLKGRRILIVEDDPLISMLEEDLLLSLGCRIVGPATSLAQAMRLAAQPGLSGALLDVNLGGEAVFPVADLLDKAKVPLVFVTGYGRRGMPSGYAHRYTIQKPFDPARFGEAVAIGLARSAG